MSHLSSHSSVDQLGSSGGHLIEATGMQLSYFIELAKRSCAEGPENVYRVHDLCLKVEVELLKFGIEIGVTNFALYTETGGTIIGYIVDIVPHAIYGIHALFVAADGDPAKNRILMEHGSYSIHLIH